MEAAAERRREVEVLRRQLASDEGALRERHGAARAPHHALASLTLRACAHPASYFLPLA